MCAFCVEAYIIGVSEQQGADQPAHPRSLISAFVICLLKSTISRYAASKNFSSVASLCSLGDWFESCFVGLEPEDRFSHVVAQL